MVQLFGYLILAAICYAPLLTLCDGLSYSLLTGQLKSSLPVKRSQSTWQLQGAPSFSSEQPSHKRPTSGGSQQERTAWKSGDIFTKSSPSSPAAASNSNYKYSDNNSNKNSNNSNNSGGDPRRRRGSKDPWWMREDEKHNPRMLKPYSPWWAPILQDKSNSNLNAVDLFASLMVSDKLKITELREVAIARGLNPEGKKSELIERINDLVHLFDLSDVNVKMPAFTTPLVNELPSCYPESYERKSK